MKRNGTQISLHSVKNLLGDRSQQLLFQDQHAEFSNEYNLVLHGTIDRLGIDLTDMESRVMEAILRGFSESGYQDHLETRDCNHVCSERFSGKVPPAYKNIQHIPILKVTQGQILEWCGVSRNCIATRMRLIQAISDLGSKQYCFYYDRLVHDETGAPAKDKRGRWVKEEIYTVDTLFTIKEVRNEGQLIHYEIFPSVIFLDQRESYFMFIPFNWREEVCALVGKKKASSYTFRFLLYLRYQHELFRRRKQPTPYILKKTKEEIAIALKMPESVYRRKVKRAEEILLDAYEVALKLGYITEYKIEDCDVFILNDRKFFSTTEIEIEKCEVKEDKDEIHLFDFFHKARSMLDPQHKVPLLANLEGKQQLQCFSDMLKERSLDQIKEVISWTIGKKYWSSHTTTPEDLSKNFEKALSDLKTSKKVTIEDVIAENRAYSEQILGKYNGKSENGVSIEILNKRIEFIKGIHSDVILFEDKEFKDKLGKAMQKWKI